MARMNFFSKVISLTDTTPNDRGKITKTGNMHEFGSNVISAGVSIQSWKLSYEGQHYVWYCGAGIENVQTEGTKVYFDVWLQLFQNDYKIDPKNAKITALISAYCE